MGAKLREQTIAETAFALMATHHVAPTPEHYQIFYLHAFNPQSPVSPIIDVCIREGKDFTPQLLGQLYRQIAPENMALSATDLLGKDISSVLGSVLNTMERAGQDAASYSQTLKTASGEMAGTQSPQDMQKLMEGLIGATKAMEYRTRMLEEELNRSSTEVADLKIKMDDLRKESMTDMLTNIPNRKSFEMALQMALSEAESEGEHFSLLMCDIDHFKRFNDTWGHQTGDQVLRLVGACLSENVKGRDTAARFGGEEFTVLLRHTHLEDALNLANQIRGHVERKKLVKKSTGDILGTLTISIGVAQYRPGDTASSLLQRADERLYAAKREGRNRVMGEETPAPSPESVFGSSAA